MSQPEEKKTGKNYIQLVLLHSIMSLLYEHSKLFISHIYLNIYMVSQSLYCLGLLNLLERMPRYTECKNWMCQRCRTHNRGSGNTCRNCRAPKAGGLSLDRLPGDWTCPKCKCSNFARNKACYKCKAARRSWYYCTLYYTFSENNSLSLEGE